MKTTPFALALAVAALASAPTAREAQAAYTGIQKCTAGDGTAIYTDRPCAQIGAAQAAVSSELGLRLANEQRHAQAGAIASDTLPVDASLPPAHGTPTGRRALAAGCARTPTQLAMDMQAAAGLGDVNRLAESYHWVGMTHEQAMPVLQRLDELTHGRIVAAQVYGATPMGLQFADASGAPAPSSGGTLLLSLQDDGATRSVQLNVESYAGCYFARF